MLSGKKILLGITGSIAAYKSAFLTRSLIKQGAEVKVIMTESACEFISPLTLSTLSQNKVFSELTTRSEWNSHVELGLWADLFIVAPATAHTMAKARAGMADNILLATYLSAKCPVWFAPAMDLDMWKHPATQENTRQLMSHGIKVLEVGTGFLASGLEGEGRMLEPDDIVTQVESYFLQQKKLTNSLSGQKILITAGPTYEAIDPVRYIGNHSSGKMGWAIAKEALSSGAEVHLVMGPTALDIPKHEKLSVYPVTSANEMFKQAKALFPKMDGAIFAAAVADYRPDKIAREKIKKKGDKLELKLVRTKDIAQSLSSGKNTQQWTVGFALESEKGAEHAMEKLQKKNFDIIVLNNLKDKGAGFKHDTNKVSLFFSDGSQKEYPLQSKQAVAQDILIAVVSKLIQTKKS